MYPSLTSLPHKEANPEKGRDRQDVRVLYNSWAERTTDKDADLRPRMSEGSNAVSITENMECPICFAPLNTPIENDARVYSLVESCGHSFHKVCLDQWFKRGENATATCVLCREPIKCAGAIETFNRLRNSQEEDTSMVLLPYELPNDDQLPFPGAPLAFRKWVQRLRIAYQNGLYLYVERREALMAEEQAARERERAQRAEDYQRAVDAATQFANAEYERRMREYNYYKNRADISLNDYNVVLSSLYLMIQMRYNLDYNSYGSGLQTGNVNGIVLTKMYAFQKKLNDMTMDNSLKTLRDHYGPVPDDYHSPLS